MELELNKSKFALLPLWYNSVFTVVPMLCSILAATFLIIVELLVSCSGRFRFGRHLWLYAWMFHRHLKPNQTFDQPRLTCSSHETLEVSLDSSPHPQPQNFW